MVTLRILSFPAVVFVALDRHPPTNLLVTEKLLYPQLYPAPALPCMSFPHAISFHLCVTDIQRDNKEALLCPKTDQESPLGRKLPHAETAPPLRHPLAGLYRHCIGPPPLSHPAISPVVKGVGT
jgi:hypothetical protein